MTMAKRNIPKKIDVQTKKEHRTEHMNIVKGRQPHGKRFHAPDLKLKLNSGGQ